MKGRIEMQKAIETLERLAKNGNIGAIQELGLRYYKGIGVEVDYSKAKNYFEEAINKGCASSAYYLGLIHYNGNGTPVNHQKAKEYFEKSDSDNNIFSTYYLGKIYYWGDGVAKDEVKANEYKTKILNKPFFANQNTGIRQFYSIEDIELASRNYANQMQQKIQSEFQSLYGNNLI